MTTAPSLINRPRPVGPGDQIIQALPPVASVIAMQSLFRGI